MKDQLQNFIKLAGIGQAALVSGSMIVPRILNWKAELAKVQPLIKQMFWTYAGYIFVINLCFGLVSVFDFKDLSNGTTLAMLVTGFIALYWISRVLIQFLYFDRSTFPKGTWNLIGEIMLVGLFIFLSGVYGWAYYFNYQFK